MKYSLKVILSLSALVAVIVGIGLIGQSILGRTSGELGQSIAKVESSTASNDWKTAELAVTQIKNKWSGIKGVWAVLIDHQEIDNIDATLARMEKFIMAKDTPSAMAEASALKNFVDHIPVKEKLLLENVL